MDRVGGQCDDDGVRALIDIFAPARRAFVEFLEFSNDDARPPFVRIIIEGNEPFGGVPTQ